MLMPHSRYFQRRLQFESLETRRVLSGMWSVAEGEGPSPVPDFQLEDTNSTSPTFGQSISPRDFLGQTTGWYFGFGT